MRPGGPLLWFSEQELTYDKDEIARIVLRENQNSFRRIEKKYRGLLLERVKLLIKKVIGDNPIHLNLKHVMEEGEWDYIGKYWDNGRVTLNYMLSEFSVDKKGRLWVTGYAFDDLDISYDFDETLLSIGEMEEFVDILELVVKELKNGILVLEKDGTIKQAENHPD